jgi:hypothetical protein
MQKLYYSVNEMSILPLLVVALRLFSPLVLSVGRLFEPSEVLLSIL